MSRRRGIFLSLFLAALVFLAMLNRRDVVISHEARVIQTAREMAASGWPWNARPVEVPDVHLVRRGDGALRLDADPGAPPLKVNPWIIPVLNDEIRLQKPPLPYWCCAVLFRIAGQWQPWLGRIPSAILGVLATLIVFDLARRLIGRRVALPAALVWVSSYFIPDEYRKTMADPYLAFFTIAVIWAWVRSALGGGRGLVVLFYVSTALGLLAKGPPLLVPVLAALILFHVMYRVRPPGRLLHHVAGLVVLAALTLPWPLYVLRHVEHAREIWRYESIGEMTDNTENARPWWFYLPILPQLALPWTPAFLVGLGMVFARLGARRRNGIQPGPNRMREVFPAAWYLLVAIFFSMVHLKKAAYLLPIIPAQAIVTGQALSSAMAAFRRWGKNSVGWVLLVAQSSIGIGFSGALVWLLWRSSMPVPTAVALALAPLLLCVMSLRMLAAGNVREWLTTLCTGYALATVLFLNFDRTEQENQRSPRPAAALVESRLKEDVLATVAPAKLPAEVSVYLPVNLTFNPLATTIYHVVDDRQGDDAMRKGRSGTRPDPYTLEYFSRLFSGARVLSATRIDVPQIRRERWKVFKLNVEPGKVYARAE